MAVSLNAMYDAVNFTVHIFNVKMEMRYNKQLPQGSSIKSTVNSYSTTGEKSVLVASYCIGRIFLLTKLGVISLHLFCFVGSC